MEATVKTAQAAIRTAVQSTGSNRRLSSMQMDDIWQKMAGLDDSVRSMAARGLCWKDLQPEQVDALIGRYKNHEDQMKKVRGPKKASGMSQGGREAPVVTPAVCAASALLDELSSELEVLDEPLSAQADEEFEDDSARMPAAKRTDPPSAREQSENRSKKAAKSKGAVRPDAAGKRKEMLGKASLLLEKSLQKLRRLSEKLPAAGGWKQKTPAFLLDPPPASESAPVYYQSLDDTVITAQGTICRSTPALKSARAKKQLANSLIKGTPLTGKVAGIEKNYRHALAAVFMEDQKILIPAEEFMDLSIHTGRDAAKIEEVRLMQRLNSEIDFVVKAYDPLKGIAIGSRKDAMEQLCQAVFFQTDREGKYRVQSGSRIQTRVAAVSQNGLTVEAAGSEAFIPSAAFASHSIPAFCRPGTRLECQITNLARSKKRQSVRLELEPVKSSSISRLHQGERYTGTVIALDSCGILVRCMEETVLCTDSRLEKWLDMQAGLIQSQMPLLHKKLFDPDTPLDYDQLHMLCGLDAALPLQPGQSVQFKAGELTASGVRTGTLIRTRGSV